MIALDALEPVTPSERLVDVRVLCAQQVEHAAILAEDTIDEQSDLSEEIGPWIEPAQSYEKHQLGLRKFFLNSLHLTWVMSLLADAVVLLRAQALLTAPKPVHLLGNLAPQQLDFRWF